MGADPLIASQRGGEHALADPTLTGQAQRMGVTGKPDRAAAHSQHYGVPSCVVALDLLKPKFPLQDRHFRAFGRRVANGRVKEAG
jgi:hypothetical protein